MSFDLFTFSNSESPDNGPPSAHSPLLPITCAWCLGLVIAARVLPGNWAWPCSLLACAAVTAAWFARSRLLLSRSLSLTAVLLIAIAWWGWRSPASWQSPGEDRQLVRVQGIVSSPLRPHFQSPAELARFQPPRPPSTSFQLEARTLEDGSGVRPVSGILLVRLNVFENRLQEGDRISCLGWLEGFTSPDNPGSPDFGRIMADQGVVGRLFLEDRSHWKLLESAEQTTGFPAQIRQTFSRMAARSLWAGLPADHPRTSAALLEMLLLGTGREDLGSLDLEFRTTGLSHMLAISGLHLGILVAGTWWLILALSGRPQVALIGSLLVLGCYLLVVPARVPVLRAGLMIALSMWGLAGGRRLQPLPLVALAALLLLIWRPQDLFSPGFQLSFAVVAALVSWCAPFSKWLSGSATRSLSHENPDGFKHILRRRAAEALSVGLISWSVSTPLVAWHFQMISPWGAPLSWLLLPVVALTLWIGYAKIALGLIFPEVAGFLGFPLWLLGDGLAWSVGGVAQLPLSVVLIAPLHAWWPLGCFLWLGAVAHARLRTWRRLLIASGLLLALWPFSPWLMRSWDQRSVALEITMVSVGNGSCYLLSSGGENLIYDCGSLDQSNVGRQSVGPALRERGIRHIDALMISHPDLDHFSGAPELVREFGIRKLLLGEAFIEDAARHPGGAAGHFLAWARNRDMKIQTLWAGWQQPLGQAELKILWPAQGRFFPIHNDRSLLLQIQTAGRSVLMCGDVQQAAMSTMLKENLPPRCDVLELPHHGSFVPAAPHFVETAAPGLILQSTGAERLRIDKWAGKLPDSAQRHITTRDGLVVVRIDESGKISSETFKNIEKYENMDEPAAEDLR